MVRYSIDERGAPHVAWLQKMTLTHTLGNEAKLFEGLSPEAEERLHPRIAVDAAERGGGGDANHGEIFAQKGGQTALVAREERHRAAARAFGAAPVTEDTLADRARSRVDAAEHFVERVGEHFTRT